MNLTGAATIQLFDGSLLATEASALPAITDTGMRVPVLEKEGFRTGLSLANTAGATESATLTLRNPDGSVQGTQTATLGPLGQTSLFVSELFPGTVAFEGSLDIASSTGAITALALKQHDSGLLSTLPVAGTSRIVESYFSPQGGTASRIIEVIEAATGTLDIAIYSFTRDDIADALLTAKERGVVIRVLADSGQAEGLGSEIARLESAGVQLKRTDGGNSSGDMHNKYLIADGRTLLTGSYNWSARAEDDSFENMVLIRHRATVADYQANFESIWSNQ